MLGVGISSLVTRARCSRRQRLIWQSLVSAICLLVVVSAAFAQDYRLGSGDVIRIDVYDEADLSFQRILIGSKGSIVYPFVGEVQVVDKTVSEIEALIVNGLKPDYLVNPRVTVSVLEYRPFFVNGEVESPGGIAYSPGLTLRKAITLAGGFSERASRSNITVISEDDPDAKPRKIGLNYAVKPGDVITVEQSFF